MIVCEGIKVFCQGFQSGIHVTMSSAVVNSDLNSINDADVKGLGLISLKKAYTSTDGFTRKIIMLLWVVQYHFDGFDPKHTFF